MSKEHLEEDLSDMWAAIYLMMDLQVREYAISVAGRLSEKNPAYVFPALRRHLIQLLTFLGQSADSKCREESAELLGYLICSCERLILPYIAPIHKALLAAKLCEGTTGVNANNGIISGVLVTVGDLARVVGYMCFFCFFFLESLKLYWMELLLLNVRLLLQLVIRLYGAQVMLLLHIMSTRNCSAYS